MSDAGQGAPEGGPCHSRIGPAARAEVGVERDPAAARAGARQSRPQPLPASLAVERQGDPGEVDQLVARQGRRQRRRGRQLEQLPRRRLAAPVGKAPLALGVRLDDVEPRQPPRQALYEAGAHALGFPARQHLGAPRIVAQRREVVDLGSQPRQVDGRVERIAAPAAREAAVGQLAQLDHALADAGDRCHGLPFRVAAACGGRADRVLVSAATAPADSSAVESSFVRGVPSLDRQSARPKELLRIEQRTAGDQARDVRQRRRNGRGAGRARGGRRLDDGCKPARCGGHGMREQERRARGGGELGGPVATAAVPPRNGTSMAPLASLPR